MHSFRPRVVGLLVAVTFVLVAALCWMRFASSPQALVGTVHHVSAIDSKPTIRDVLAGRRHIAKVRLRELLSTDDSSLRLGSARIEWSVGVPGESGYLYFDATDLKRGAWEFAPCASTQLSQVHEDNARCDFYGHGHPKGTNAFGENWRNRTIIVHKGGLLLLRQANLPQIVYAMKLKNQDGNKLKVDYLEMHLPTQ